jgi:integrase
MRFWKDIPNQEKRVHVRERVCPISGPGLLSKSERKRRAREIIQASGADSPEYFHEVVKPNPVGVTFREQSEIWLKQLQNRKRSPIGESYAVTIQGALDKWILPAIGDLPLANVDNLSVKPLIDKICKSKLSPRSVNKYLEHIKQVVESLKLPNGEPVHKRTWDPETMDLPMVHYSEQKRPSLKADVVSNLIQSSSSQEQALYVLLAATGMRVSEALAVESKHFINNGRTIVVEQQVKKNVPCIVRHLKTDAALREIDLHPDIAEYLRKYMAGKKGLLFYTATGTPISTITWKPAGSRPDSLSWDSTKKGWVGTPSSDSVRRGSAVSVVWRTSTIFGCRTVRRPCRNCTHTFTRNWVSASQKLSESVTDSL